MRKKAFDAEEEIGRLKSVVATLVTMSAASITGPLDDAEAKILLATLNGVEQQTEQVGLTDDLSTLQQQMQEQSE